MSAIKVEKATPARLKELDVESWSPWSCGVETFDWEYSEDETAYILEGRVRVITQDGQDVTLEAGDLVFFPRGVRCTWAVETAIKKVFTFQ